MDKERKKKKLGIKKESFLAHYKWWLVMWGGILLLGYIMLYCWFSVDGFFYVGYDLEKSDWLVFSGAYLSFGGTIIVSVVASFQSSYYTKKQKERDDEERKKKIQPIFSVAIGEINGQLLGMAEPFFLNDPSKNIRHENVTIHIENAGEYPVLHVILFDSYRCQLLKPGEKKTFQCAYEDSPDVNSKSKSLIRILKSEYEPAKDGVPSWFNINYEDIDGHCMYQTFTLSEFDGTQYYSLEAIEEA